MKPLTIILTLSPILCFGQLNNSKLIDNLALVTDMPYICETTEGVGCGDKIFWQVVEQKKNIISLLINRLSDTTQTKATVPNFGGQWTVADIAYAALQEIIKGIPTFDLMKVKFDTEGCGYCSYWNYLREDKVNRLKFQAAVRNWYNTHKANLVWVASNEFMTCDCGGRQHPNGGHYELSK